MPPEIPLYPTKTLKYQICDFFLERRRKEPGLGTPLSIKLRELGPLLEYAIGEDRIKALRNELLSLHDERFGNLLDRQVINISNLPNHDNFKEAFETDQPLEVRCSSENLEDYILLLKTRTKAAINAKLYGGRVVLESLPNNRLKIIFDNKTMVVNKTKTHTFDFCIRMVQLMYGEVIRLHDNDISIIDYEKGNHIAYRALMEPLQKIEGITADEESEINQRSLEDAVRFLNIRSVEKLGYPLFRTDDQGLEWVL